MQAGTALIGSWRLESFELEGLGRCEAYVAEPAHRDAALVPYTWYRALVEVGCEALGFPAAYLADVRAVPAALDPDPNRHAEHMAIWRRAREAGLD